ncbi:MULTISPECIES: four helix bundle protein [Phyllobacteriaceae]|jgi:four helix bundle protein|uniref:four helix bundle protein n=2 Tax=Hyphomicrobiales TaxID=356 RepID=UPI0009DE8826|nr:four helix bundle protein [Mesorhizobium sp. YL-MeA3-2017]MBN9235352.1 four helix bundle protein [Mesorhizobium sp.]MDQ0332727.1 four helix bundle protein [Mesorhizobium sp. YL-MeA3-2017]
MTSGWSAIGSRQSVSDHEPPLGSENSKIGSYRDLRVWNLAIELAVDCYEQTRAFPQSELYGLTSQLRRAATSVAANIAEGYGRENTGSYVQFLRIAQGSLKEFETHIIISTRVGFLEAEAQRRFLAQANDIGRMLRALIRSLQRAS